MNFQISLLVLFCLSGRYSAQWTASGGISTGNKGPKINLGLSHTSGRWTFKGTGSVGLKGNWGAGFGASFKFKRSAEDNKYNIVIRVNECNFDVYDNNSDGVITLDEINLLFASKTLGQSLFQSLNIVKDNGGITKDEFEKAAKNVIRSC